MMSPQKKQTYQNVCNLLSALEAIQNTLPADIAIDDKFKMVIDGLIKFSQDCRDKLESTY